MLVRSDRRYRFPVGPAEVWHEATAIERYRAWWPWLRRFDATAFEAGAVWHCEVKPPLPYAVRLTVTIDDLVPERHVLASIGGDVTGTARMTVSGFHDGCEVHLESALAPANGMLRVLAAVARPIVRFGHDWVLDSGARQFSAAALPDVDPDPVP